MFKESDASTLTGKILKIMSRSSNEQHNYPCVQVQWYYKKKDIDFRILRISEADQIYIADNENKYLAKDIKTIVCNSVFPTNHKDVVPLESIICKVKVLHLKDYQDLAAVNQSIYYTRAKYDVIQNRMFPPFCEWERICKCKKPQNPSLLLICCEMCEKWFHPFCFGIRDAEVESIVAFYCDICKQKRKRDKKKKGKKAKKSKEDNESCYLKKIKEDF